MPDSFDVTIVRDVAFDVPLGQPGTPGAKGDPGDPGTDGTSATVAVGTVTTGEPGTDAEVENVGTASAAVLNFTIPRGDPGAGGGGAGAWGAITGTLSDQTDLQAALDGKSDTGHTHAQADVTGLSAALDGKSDDGHTHTAADVTDFDAEVSANTDVAANTTARHTHANAAVLDATTASFTTADETKLDGIASGATANDTDANLKNRANHTGTQTASTISDFAETVRDTMGTALVAGAGVTVTPNDGADTITVASDGNAAVNTVAATGSTETLSAAYELHKVTMDQNCTFTFTSPSAGAVFAVLLSGSFTPTWPASVDWPDGSAPTYSTPALYVFATFDGGTTWQGVQSGKAFA